MVMVRIRGRKCIMSLRILTKIEEKVCVCLTSICTLSLTCLSIAVSLATVAYLKIRNTLYAVKKNNNNLYLYMKSC